jgi:hypothetical protein
MYARGSDYTKCGTRRTHRGLSTVEAAAGEVALGAGFTGGDVECVLQRLDTDGSAILWARAASPAWKASTVHSAA